MMDASLPNPWKAAAENLICAVGLARNAYRDTRRPRAKLSDAEIDRILACELEIGKYLREARRHFDRSERSGDGATERRIVLDLLRAHSLVWEGLAIQYDGIPNVVTGEMLGQSGEQITQHVIEAIRLLKATNPAFEGVSWNGVELHRPPSR